METGASPVWPTPPSSHPRGAPVPVPLPEVPSVGEEELGRSVVRGFVEALRHSREGAHQEIARGLEEQARLISREILANGVLEGRSEAELPAALLATLYKWMGCRVSAWRETPGWGIVVVEDCPLRRSLALVGVNCRAVCLRMGRGALETLPGSVASRRMPGGSGCVHLLRMDREAVSEEVLT